MPATSYQTAAEIKTRIAALLISTDRQRAALLAQSDGDILILAQQASSDIDAVAWLGEKAEFDTAVQQLQWPRVRPEVEGQRPDGVGYISQSAYFDPDTIVGSVPNIPYALKDAHTLQTAFLAWRAAGLDPIAHEQQAAALGITSQSEGGVSTSRDLTRATDPWAKLCTGAQTAMAKYRRRSGSVV